MVQKSVRRADADEQLRLAREAAREAVKAAIDEELARHAFKCGLERLSQALNVPANGGLVPDRYPFDLVAAAQHIVENMLPALSALAAERRQRASLLWQAGHICSAAAEAAEEAGPRHTKK